MFRELLGDEGHLLSPTAQLVLLLCSCFWCFSCCCFSCQSWLVRSCSLLSPLIRFNNLIYVYVCGALMFITFLMRPCKAFYMWRCCTYLLLWSLLIEMYVECSGVGVSVDMCSVCIHTGANGHHAEMSTCAKFHLDNHTNLTEVID